MRRSLVWLWPEKFLNETNGVSPRRFLRLANPRLSGLITARLGDHRWLTDLERLGELEAFADDEEFRAQWREGKWQNKLDLAFHALATTDVAVDPGSMFDVMVKRLHEYKRQLLKLLHVVTFLNTARSGYFSSDRTVRGYCRDIWHLESVPVPADTSESRDVLP